MIRLSVAVLGIVAVGTLNGYAFSHAFGAWGILIGLPSEFLGGVGVGWCIAPRWLKHGRR